LNASLTASLIASFSISIKASPFRVISKHLPCSHPAHNSYR
jgi:hypothetical protein